MIVLSLEKIKSLILEFRKKNMPLPLLFEEIDDGDLYRLSNKIKLHNGVAGKFFLCSTEEGTRSVLSSPGSSIALIVLEAVEPEHELFGLKISIENTIYYIQAFRSSAYQNVPETLNIMLAPVQELLFSRIEGLFETDILDNKKVLIIGLGSGGSPVVLELAKTGVQNFILIDHDRLEVGNLARHVCGLSDLGRYKTKAVKDLILEKNPYAQIETLEIKVSWENKKLVESLVDKADLVICATDNRESRMLVNRICVELNKVCLYGGAFRRAYGGQVLRVIPKLSICYQCFLNSLPDVAQDEEVSNQEQASRVQYSPNDPLVPIEPGLSTDIAPISLMLSKLAILELLKGSLTTFQSLYTDFVASWYLWLNRREPGTNYENLEPLGYECDDLRIMRWYGVEIERDLNCSVCGDFLPEFNSQITQEDINFFES